MPQTIEIALYCHGVDGDLKGRSHMEDFYLPMHNGIRKWNSSYPDQCRGIEWGWPHPGGRGSCDDRLAAAQRELGSRVMPVVDKTWEFTLNPARAVINAFRPLIFYNFADMFYYVSEDGKSSVRNTIAHQVAAHLRLLTDQAEPAISLTLIGHSAGSVIWFDFLFHLFYPGEHQYISGQEDSPDVKRLRELAKTGKLRVRRLFTFGCPVAPFACRSNPVIDILASGGHLDPAHYGLTVNPFGDRLANPRWVNLWDRDDPIGWPVEPLMIDRDGAVRDQHIDVSMATTKAHDAYWKSTVAQQALAKAW